MDVMRFRNRIRLCAPALVAASIQIFASLGQAASPPPPRGVIVERLEPGFSAQRSGMQEEDRILSWSRESGSKSEPIPVRSPFDLFRAEMEDGPLGRIVLDIERRGERVRIPLEAGPWKIYARPDFAPGDLALFEEANRRAAEPDGAKAAQASWSALARDHERAGRTGWAAWIWMRAADLAAGKKDGFECFAAEQAEETAARSEERAVAATVAGIARAKRADSRGDREDQEKTLRDLLSNRHTARKRDLTRAVLLDALGRAIRRHLPSQSEEAFAESLEIRRRAAPESFEISTSLNGLASLAFDRGDPVRAAGLAGQALAIRQRLAPGSFEMARILNLLGNCAAVRGDAAAQSLYGQAAEIFERFAPASTETASTINNLGILSLDRGDLGPSEQFFRRALDIRRAISPDDLDVADSLSNLAFLMRERGDLTRSAQYHREALAIIERLAPGTLDHASILANIGALAWAQGDLAGAEDLFRRAEAIQSRVAPDGLDAARWLYNLGTVQASLEEHDLALDSISRALAIQDRFAPGALDTASMVVNLADVETAAGDIETAGGRYDRALTIFARLAPGSTREAVALRAAAERFRLIGNRGRELDLLCEALRSLESQRNRIGGTEETKSSFSTEYMGWYRDMVSRLVASGNGAEAFGVFERSRARSLLGLLAGRDLVFEGEVPPSLEKERHALAAEYDRALAALGRIEERDASAIDKARGELHRIRWRQEEVAGEIRQASPRVASLRDPAPLDFETSRRTLDPGTLLLGYSVGKSETVLFIFSSAESEPAVRRLSLGEAAARNEIDRFRRVIEASSRLQPPENSLEPEIRRLSASISRKLLAPASREIAAAQRILVIPDGPLHLLPFSALQDPSTLESGSPRYLVESKPVHSVVSMTVLNELRASRRERGKRRLAAFGDPVFPTGAEATPWRGESLGPLPATRKEVESIAAAAPQDSSVWLGAQASEGRVRAIGPDTAIVHFACHGVVDEESPLDSGLVLSPSASAAGVTKTDNGFLQAWEIFEGVRLDADLVTLSACRSAVGKEVGGEGLVGLSRAFTFAGARSVVASLWNVADESTAELMGVFYRELFAGIPKDEALRRAQCSFLSKAGTLSKGGSDQRQDRWRSPFHWAAFELIGDWK